MRIAHVANFYGPSSGGLRTTMHALACGYAARGHDVLLVVPGARAEVADMPWGRLVAVPAPRIIGSGGYRAVVSRRRVTRVLSDWAPDRLEVSDRTTLRFLGRWASARRIPSVFVNHERVDGVLRAHLPRVIRAALPLGLLANAHNRATARRFDAVVCTTAFARQEFDRIGVRTHVVPLGVDLHTFRPERRDARVLTGAWGPRSGEALVVMASRLSREKAPHLAIDAVRILSEAGVRARLVCAGAGPLQRAMRRRARGLPVEFAGFVSDRSAYADLLAAADVVVAPGPIETFGLAALEALASGTPVVVNARSALPEVVGSAGVAAQGTPAAFADAIAEVLSRDSRARRADARHRAENFPWSATVDAMLALHGATRARRGPRVLA